MPRQKKCKITDVQIEATIEYTMPDWPQSTDHPDQQLAAKWNHYHTRLLAHERRHGALVKAATLEVERKILSADDTSHAPPNCRQLKRIANERAQSVIKKLERQHQEFDKITDHGKNNGATFP